MMFIYFITCVYGQTSHLPSIVLIYHHYMWAICGNLSRKYIVPFTGKKYQKPFTIPRKCVCYLRSVMCKLRHFDGKITTVYNTHSYFSLFYFGTWNM